MSRFRWLLAVVFASTACELGDRACLRHSECESPYACVEGTCRSNESLPSTSDAGAFTDAATDA